MPSWKSIDVLCHNEKCNKKWPVVVEKERENECFSCPKCGHASYKTISAVTILKASYPDGHLRSDGVGRAMEVDRLEREMDLVDGDVQAMSDVAEAIVRKHKEGGGTI